MGWAYLETTNELNAISPNTWNDVMIISDNGLVEMYVNGNKLSNYSINTITYGMIGFCTQDLVELIMDTIGLVLQRLVVSHDTTWKEN